MTHHLSGSRIAHSFWRDALALAFLGLLTILFFWPVFFAGYWLPRGGGDLVSFLWPQYSFAGEAIRSGSIPLWNPYLYSGAPFLADNQAGVLYPINLLASLIFPNLPYQVMEGSVIFHIWLAGAAMYVALRMWLRPPLSSLPFHGGDRGGALFGAIAFMFNDVLITHIGNLNLIAVAAWLPLILALYARGLSERRASWIVGSSVVFAVALLAGHAQMTAITLVGLLAVAVWHIILQVAALRQDQRVHSMADGSQWEASSTMRAAGRRSLLKLIGLALLTPLIALGLTALQFLPSLEMMQYSLRASLSYEEATAYSLPPAALASTFSPLLFGRGAAEFWGPWQRVETMYVGVVPLMLAGFAFSRPRRKPALSPRPRGEPSASPRTESAVGQSNAWFFLALGMLSLLIALGQYTPVYSLVHSLPVLGGLRVPARFILLTNFSLAALAAIGLQRFMTESFSSKRVLGWGATVMIGGALVLVLAYQSTGAIDRSSNLASSFSFLFMAIIALGVMLLRVKSVVNRQHSALLLIGLLSLDLILLGSGVEIDRNDPTLGYQHQAVVDFLKSDGSMFRIENASNAWQPDAALLQRVQDIGGIFNPLGLASYETYRGGMGNRGSPLYNFLGAKYVLANKDQPPGDASFVPVFNGDPQLDAYLNTNALPRALLIERAQAVSSGEEAWQAIHAAEFKPGGEVIVEGPALDPQAMIDGERNLAFTHYSNERVELSALTPITAYVVLSDVFYPGWTATLDDQPAPLYPANFAFRAVLMPPGEHRVTFIFEPLMWRVGIGVSAITLFGLIGYAVWHWQRTRRR